MVVAVRMTVGEDDCSGDDNGGGNESLLKTMVHVLMKRAA